MCIVQHFRILDGLNAAFNDDSIINKPKDGWTQLAEEIETFLDWATIAILQGGL